jgi:hypothetical protein
MKQSQCPLFKKNMTKSEIQKQINALEKIIREYEDKYKNATFYSAMLKYPVDAYAKLAFWKERLKCL